MHTVRSMAPLLFLLLASCAAQQLPLGIRGGQLAGCPPTPNCVSSDATDPLHSIAPYATASSPMAAWVELQNVLATMPRVRKVKGTTNYLHLEVRSPLLRFVDDLEFYLRSREGLIAVRSASRRGRSDLGVNRERIEKIRAALQARGVVR